MTTPKSRESSSASSLHLSSSSPSLGPSAFLPHLFLVTALLLNALYPPRNHGSHFEKHKIAAQEGAADDNAEMDELRVHEASTRRGSILEEQEKSSVDKV